MAVAGYREGTKLSGLGERAQLILRNNTPAPRFRLVLAYKVSLLLVDVRLVVLYIIGSLFTPLTYTPVPLHYLQYFFYN